MTREDVIRSLIKKAGMSIRAFAESIDLPYTTLHSMLSRGIGNASIDNVLKVCKGLGITVEELEALANEGNINKRKGGVDIIDNYFEKETSKELQLIQRAHKKMDAKQRKKMMDILKLTFEELFNEEEE